MPQWTKIMNIILQKRIEEAARDIAELCPDCDLHCKGKNPCIPKILYQKLIEISTFALQNQLVSVEEALPKFQQAVVVTNSEGDYWTSWRLNDNCEDTDDNGFVNNGIGEITHWMEIPKLPKGGEK